MWIFHERIARLRTTRKILVQIDNHPEATLVGKWGAILTAEHAQKFPLDDTKPAVVKVQFTDNKAKQREEEMEVQYLSPRRIKQKGDHVLISGTDIGEVVRHIRTEGSNARVITEGKTKGKTVVITHLCPIE